MIAQFYDFQSIAIGVLQIFIIIAIGFILSFRKLITKDGCDALSALLLWVCLPALISTRITTTFDPSVSRTWWFLPVCSVIMSTCGMIIGFLILKTIKDFTSQKEFILSCGFQNCGYLPMALVAFVCSGEACNIMLVYIFLFIIGFNMMMWSFSFAFLTENFRHSFKIRRILTPPVVSTIISIILVFGFGSGWLPIVIETPLRLIGDASFPLALILLGASIFEYRGYHVAHIGSLCGCLIVKLLILPLLTLVLMSHLNMNIMYKFIIFLQSTMPTAVSLVIIGAQTKKDNRFFSGVIVYSHLIAIITVPIWLMIFNAYV